MARVQALISGTQKHFPNGHFTLGKVTYTTATLVQALQSLIDALNDVNAAHALVKDALAKLQTVTTSIVPLMRTYRRFIQATFANATQELADFGMAPPRTPAPRTAEQKAAAVAKLRATRAARGTTSKKKKLAIHGDVTGVNHPGHDLREGSAHGAACDTAGEVGQRPVAEARATAEDAPRDPQGPGSAARKSRRSPEPADSIRTSLAHGSGVP